MMYFEIKWGIAHESSLYREIPQFSIARKTFVAFSWPIINADGHSTSECFRGLFVVA